MKKEKWNIPPIYESPVMEHFFVLKGKNKETLRFFTTPEYALYLGNCGVQKDPELNSTFKKAEKLFELYDFTKREAAIASAFFELGSNLNKVYSYPDVQELEQRKQKNKNKGRGSSYLKYDSTITKHLNMMQNFNYKTLNEAYKGFCKETGMKPSFSSFKDWWAKHKKGFPPHEPQDSMDE